MQGLSCLPHHGLLKVSQPDVCVCVHARRWDTGTILFDSVHAALDLQPTGPLFAQAAEAGLSHQATLRHVVSSATRRAGLPAIPTPFAENIQRTIFMTLLPPRVSRPWLYPECKNSLPSLCDALCLKAQHQALVLFGHSRNALCVPGKNTTTVKVMAVRLRGAVFWLQDYHSEMDAQLVEDQIYTEQGLFNEALVERPAYDEPRKMRGKPQDPNTPFVPVGILPCPQR